MLIISSNISQMEVIHPQSSNGVFDKITFDQLNEFKSGHITAKQFLEKLKGDTSPERVYFHGYMKAGASESKLTIQIEGALSSSGTHEISVVLEIVKDADGKLAVSSYTPELGKQAGYHAKRATKTEFIQAVASWAYEQDESVQEIVVGLISLQQSLLL